jgi:hypothetical protein
MHFMVVVIMVIVMVDRMVIHMHRQVMHIHMMIMDIHMVQPRQLYIMVIRIMQTWKV